jgi:hypothetical protein
MHSEPIYSDNTRPVMHQQHTRSMPGCHKALLCILPRGPGRQQPAETRARECTSFQPHGTQRR